VNPHADPFLHFAEWFEAARAADQPEAVSLATADAEGRPANRMVLVRRWSSEGFEVHTPPARGRRRRRRTRARRCAGTGRASGGRCVEGLVTRLTGSGLMPTDRARRAATASRDDLHQSQPVEATVLAERLCAVEVEHEGRDVPGRSGGAGTW
jgi:pyridoxamine 5'-phosphate oxidase